MEYSKLLKRVIVDLRGILFYLSTNKGFKDLWTMIGLLLSKKLMKICFLLLGTEAIIFWKGCINVIQRSFIKKFHLSRFDTRKCRFSDSRWIGFTPKYTIQ